MLQNTVLLPKLKDCPKARLWGSTPILELRSLDEAWCCTCTVTFQDLTASAWKGAGGRIPVIVCGRAPGKERNCRFVLIEDVRISSQHFAISYSGFGHSGKRLKCDAWLTDLSSNGTYVNSQLVGKGKTVPVKNGDEILVLPAIGTTLVGFVFRNTTELFEAHRGAQLASEIEEDVTCPICSILIYKAVTVGPCLHVFCAACLSEWLAQSRICPTCRGPCLEISRNRVLDSVVEAVERAWPEKKVRSDEERAQMDSIDIMGKCDALILQTSPLAPTSEAAGPSAAEESEPPAEHEVEVRVQGARVVDERHPGTAVCKIM